ESTIFRLSVFFYVFFFFSSRRRHTRCLSDWSSDVCSSDLRVLQDGPGRWPDIVPPGWDGPLQYTVGIVMNIGGSWYGSAAIQYRSEERRVGKECRSRGSREQ